LEWSLRQRTKLRVERAIKRLNESEEYEDLLAGLTRAERDAYLGVAASLSSIPEIELEETRTVLRSVIDAREDAVVRRLIEQISDEEDPTQQRL
jgi:hypothetical protein